MGSFSLVLEEDNKLFYQSAKYVDIANIRINFPVIGLKKTGNLSYTDLSNCQKPGMQLCKINID